MARQKREDRYGGKRPVISKYGAKLIKQAAQAAASMGSEAQRSGPTTTTTVTVPVRRNFAVRAESVPKDTRPVQAVELQKVHAVVTAVLPDKGCVFLATRTPKEGLVVYVPAHLFKGRTDYNMETIRKGFLVNCEVGPHQEGGRLRAKIISSIFRPITE